MKRALISIAIFLFLLALAGIIMEMMATGPQRKMRYFRTRNVFQYEVGHTVYDPVLGYRLSPKLDVAFDNVEFKSAVRTNAVGFRDDDRSLAAPDVLFLGDSYVFGWGVDEVEGVEKQYEKLSGKKVLNMGVPGYSNVQELMMLYKWAQSSPPNGKKVVLFLSANDFLDNENTSFDAFPYFIDSNGTFIVNQPTPDAVASWQATVNKWTIHTSIAKSSMLAFYFFNAIRNMQVKDIYKDYQGSHKAVQGNKAFILVAEQLAAFAKQYQCPVTIAYIPATDTAHNKQLPLVRGVCRKLGLGFADLSPVLTEDDYYPLDKHWTSTGHAKAAAYLSRQQAN
jgi:hypothetical protein